MMAALRSRRASSSLGEYACDDDEADWNNASIIQIDCG